MMIHSGLLGERSQAIHTFLWQLREEIISAFQQLENQERADLKSSQEESSFERNQWNYQRGEGGGEMALLRAHFLEKAAVNFSSVGGNTFPGEDGEGPFQAVGVSLIGHPRSPHAPTVHFNIRYITTPKRSWFGGGYDLTPMGFGYEVDTAHFHSAARHALMPYPGLYERFSADAADYFFIPHRGRERGVGGIFFDHYNSGEFDEDFSMWQAVGKSFLPAILPIWERRLALPYSSEEREKQLLYRGHYVEYNLLYDRGTRFGFRSGGNPEAILCSMPPLASW